MVLRRTTDLLAIAIVGLTVIMVGGRLSEWWGTTPEDIPRPEAIAADEAGNPGNWGTGGTPVTVELGGSRRSLRRETIQATESELDRRLVDWCRRMVEESELPAEPPNDAELRLTRRLARLTPETDAPRRGRVYRIVRPTRLIIGTRSDGASVVDKNRPKANDDASNADSRFDATDATRSERIVCWGFAFPQGPKTWALFLSGSAEAAQRGNGLPEIPLPKGCEPLLTVQNDAGDGMMTFVGTAGWEETVRSLEDGFRSKGWTIDRPGRAADGRWTARYATPKSTEPRIGWTGAVNVQLQQEPDGRVSGLMNFLPAR